VSLETTAYTTRDEFVARLLAVFQALDTLASPGPVVVADRLGVRYINRLTGDDAGPGLRRLVREEVFGPLTIQMPSGSEFLASLSQAHFKLDGPQMQARWGRLPPGAIFLPGIDPFESTSWFLDIDVFFEGQQVFSPGPTADAARHAASHAYRFFRWAMSDEFIAQRRVS
jgi:uncharacterized protein (TIGR04255 family)